MQRLTPPDPEGYWLSCYPYANPAHREELIEGLRRAGLEI